MSDAQALAVLLASTVVALGCLSWLASALYRVGQ